jgi:hypothetical protein
VFTVGRALESLTDGYGIGFNYFSLAGWFVRFAWWEQWLFLFGLGMMLFMAGFACTTVFKRGGALRLVVVLTGWTMGAVAASALVTWREWWPAVGEWTLRQTPASAGVIMLLIAAALGLGAYWSMRKTVP